MKRIGFTEPDGIIILLRAIQHPLLRLRVNIRRCRPRPELGGRLMQLDPEALVFFVQTMEKASGSSVGRIGRVHHGRDAFDVFGELFGEVAEKRDDNPTRIGNLGRSQLFESFLDFFKLSLDRLPNSWQSIEPKCFSK